VGLDWGRDGADGSGEATRTFTMIACLAPLRPATKLSACAMSCAGGSWVLLSRGYHNRNPAAFIGTHLEQSRKMESHNRVFKHYGILFGKTNLRMTARLYYYHVQYNGYQKPEVVEPRVLCEASTAEPHFMETLYSTHNRSACYHMGRLIARRAHECGVLQHTSLLKFALGRPLGVHDIKDMVRTLSFKTSARMRAFATGYKEERALLFDQAEAIGLKVAVDGDGAEADAFEHWPTIDGKPAGKERERDE